MHWGQRGGQGPSVSWAGGPGLWEEGVACSAVRPEAAAHGSGVSRHLALPWVRRSLGAHSQRRMRMGLGAGPSCLPRTSERQAPLNLNFFPEPLSGLLSPHVSGPRPPPYIPVLYAWPTCTLKADPDLRHNVTLRASQCSSPPHPYPNPNPPPVFLSQRRANYSLNGQGTKLGVFFDSSLSFPPPRSPTCKHC